METALGYFITVLLSVNGLLMGAIFIDIRSLKKEVQDFLIREAGNNEKVDNLEKRLEKLEIKRSSV